MRDEKKFKMIFLAGVIAFAIAAAVLFAFAPRSPSKHSILEKKSHPYGLASKGGGQLEVALVSDVASPIPVSSAFALTATVSATSSLHGLQYEWIVPVGVQVTGGNVSGVIGNLENGETTELKIQLLNAISDNRQVQLHVFRLLGGEPIGHMEQFNTRNQTKIAEEIRAKADVLSTSSAERSPAAERRKIMQ